MTPQFIGIGTQRAGTTWLYRVLSIHPQIAMPRIKEIHYFDRDPKYPSPSFLQFANVRERLYKQRWRTREGIGKIFDELRHGRLDGARWYANWYFSHYTDDWYRRLFSTDGTKITGEITPSYSLLEEADVERMRSVCGESKILFMVRNPIYRAWSMCRYDGRLDIGNSDAVLAYLDSSGQELRSDYERTFDLFAKYFGANRIMVGFFDAVAQQPAELYADICRFLGCEPVVQDPSLFTTVVNASREMEMPPYARTHLVKKYTPMLERLAESWGGYCSLWLEEARTENTGIQNASPICAPTMLVSS